MIDSQTSHRIIRLRASKDKTMSDDKRKALDTAIKKVQEDKDLKPEQKARQIEVLRLESELEAENEKLSGVGLRWAAGQTRGKGSQVIKWLRFDESDPASMPKSLEEFTKAVNDSKVLPDGLTAELGLAFMIVGLNDYLYTQASDPIAEFVEPSWSPAVQTQFKLVVRNYARATSSSIEDAVALIKPGVEKAQASA